MKYVVEIGSVAMIYREIFNVCTGSTALRFTAVNASPAARHIRILENLSDAILRKES
jgi:hypothetical protein